MVDKLLPKHIDIPEIYQLVIALLLGHPVSGMDIKLALHMVIDIFFSCFY